MATRYQQGRDTEYQAQRDLAANGWPSTRMAGSKGTADIIAWNIHGTRFIQCKRYSARAGSYTKDLAALMSITLPPNATAELWIRKARTHGWQEQLLIQHTYADKMDLPTLDDLGRQQAFVRPINPDPVTQISKRPTPWNTKSASTSKPAKAPLSPPTGLPPPTASSTPKPTAPDQDRAPSSTTSPPTTTPAVPMTASPPNTQAPASPALPAETPPAAAKQPN